MKKKYSGSTSSVFKIDSIAKEFKKRKKFSIGGEIKLDESLSTPLEVQRKLSEFLDYNFNLTKKTEIKNGPIKIKNYISFRVKMYSEPIHKTIKIKWDKFEQGYGIFNEFQEEKVFDILFDINFKYLYIFTNKDVSNAFVKRLKNEKKIEGNSVYFDFSKIDNFEDKLIQAWGYWETGEGNIRRIAGFGKNVGENIEDFDKVTTLYIDYKIKVEENETEEIQLILSKEGRISTQSKFVNENKILELFNEINEVLKSSK